MSASISDEASRPRQRSQDTGDNLLSQVLTRDNLQRAWKFTGMRRLESVNLNSKSNATWVNDYG